MPAVANKVHIRWMIRRDMPEVLEIGHLGFTDAPWTEHDFIRCLRQRSCIGMVAERGDDVVGYVIYELFKNRLDILNLAVHPSCWRSGVGRQIVDKLKAKLAPERRKALVCEVRETNVKAQIFFKALGFRCVGMIQSHYDDVVEDAYRFRFDCPGECQGR